MEHSDDKSKVKRVQVTFTDRQWKLIEQFRGIMGARTLKSLETLF